MKVESIKFEKAEEDAEKFDNYTYRMVSERGYSEYVGEYDTYGIEVTSGAQECVNIVHDISIIKENILELVKCMNRNRLSVVHFKDVIEDFLIQ